MKPSEWIDQQTRNLSVTNVHGRRPDYNRVRIQAIEDLLDGLYERLEQYRGDDISPNPFALEPDQNTPTGELDVTR